MCCYTLAYHVVAPDEKSSGLNSVSFRTLLVLQAKELELQAVEQILHHPTLTAATYRKWRHANALLLQEVSKRSQAAGGAAER